MKTAKRPPHQWLLLPAVIFGWLVSLATASAQTATGTVQGHVFNPATKEFVQNAEVRLEGSPQVVFTENDGFFQFTNVPAGTANVSISFSGYTTAKEVYNVTAGQIATREINLVSTAEAPTTSSNGNVVKLEAFSVSTTREGNAKAVQAQRKDMNIITSVSSDVFGDVPDGNVGEFLKYLPGVDLDYVESEPRGPRLGGMDGQYVGVSFDGVRNANADANRGSGSASRATSFEGFSITSIESVEINRTASPENDADAPAGTVNMKTKRAFDRKGRVFTYNYNVNFNGEEFSLNKQPGIEDGYGKYKDYKWTPSWQASYAESFFDRKFGILLSASHNLSYTEQAAVTVDMNRTTPTATDPRPLVVRDISWGDGPKFITKDALLLTTDWKATPKLTLSFNASYSYFEGHFQNRNFELLGANNNLNVLNGRSTIGGDGVLTVISPRDLSQPTNTAAVPTANNGLSSLINGGGGAAKMTYSRQFVPRFEYKSGDWIVEGYGARSYARNNYDALERGFSKDESNAVPSGWIATRPNAQSWEWTVHQTSGNDWFDMHSFTGTTSQGASTSGTRVSNDNRTWVTAKWTGQGDVTWNVPFLSKFPTKMKFGGKWDQEIRNNHQDTEQDTYSYNGPGGNTVTINPTNGAYQVTSFGNWANVGTALGQAPDQYISKFPFDMGTTNSMAGGGVYNIKGILGMPPRAARFEMANLYHAHPEMFTNMTTPENYYSDHYVNATHYTQTIKAGYWQADTRLSNKLQVRFGVRAEKTHGDELAFDPLTRAQMLAMGIPLNAVGTNSGRPLTVAGMKAMFETNPKIDRYKDYTDWFPSVVAKYQITPQLEWQAGFNKAIARPAIGDITGLWSQNDNVNPPTVTAANPQLLPEYHKVYQSRLAYYFGGKSPGQVSVAFIQDEATNYVESHNFTAAEYGVTDPDYAGYTFVSKTNSINPHRYRNFDFNYNQTLGFLPSEYLRGISVGGTVSRSMANQRTNGQAPWRATARLGYKYRKFGTSIGAIWVDNRPQDSIYGRYWGAMTKYDLSFTYVVNKYVTLYCTSRNPTNVKDEYYESPPGVTEGKHGVLRKQEEYGDNWIFGVSGLF